MLTAGASVLVPGFHVAPTKLSINASCPGRALITTDSFLKVPPCPSHQLETLSASCQLWGCLSQRDLGHPVPLSFHYSPCMLTPWVTVKFSIPVFELCDLHRATTLARDKHRYIIPRPRPRWNQPCFLLHQPDASIPACLAATLPWNGTTPSITPRRHTILAILKGSA